MYYIAHKIIGYVVYETESLDEAREELKHWGKRSFEIVDSKGNTVK